VRAQLGPVPRLVFDRLLASVVAAIELRESVGLMMSEYSYQMRRIFLAIADRLVAQGDLSKREDLFFLTYDEMQALAAGRLQPARRGRSLPSVAARWRRMRSSPRPVSSRAIPTRSAGRPPH
jgi:hypothetical protein